MNIRWSLAVGVAVVALSIGGVARADQAYTDATATATQADPMTVVLDASLAPRGLMSSHMEIPVTPGAFTLVYPKWIPGEHGPTGPLGDLAALRISGNGKSIAWQRDTIDMYAFHLVVPPGVSKLDVDFTVLLNAPHDMMSTGNLAIVNWNRDLLYQAQTNSHNVFVKPSVVLPAGWHYGTALAGTRSGNRITLPEVDLATLVDSPFDMGRFAKHIVLWSQGGASQTLDAFADAPEDLDFPKKLVDEYKRMTPEAIALYGSRHWIHYHSLLVLSDAIGFQGIEHHSSSDDRAPDDFMTKAAEQVAGGDLLTHEFSHSWNGKYRRPADLTTPNFQVPMQTDLLWVYEGMNQYLGDLLSFRAGIRDPKTYPDYLAAIYADMDNETGRATTPLIDTTTGAPWRYVTGGDYSDIRRTAGDFYTEGELIWLDADTIIREKTDGKKSLDDFEHAYAGPPSGAPTTVTYTRDQIENLLHSIVPYDWHAFFQRYVYDVSVHPPTDMIARSGWRLVYNDKPNAFMVADDMERHVTNAWYSLGINIGATGAVGEVRQNSPAWQAGIAPHSIIEAIDGRAYSSDVLDAALKHAQHDTAPISLLLSRGGWFTTVSIAYHGGPRFPHLERVTGKPDMLGAIMAAHAKAK